MIAAAWRHDERAPARPGDFVATLGFVSGDYIAVVLASMRLGAVSVPLAASATPGGLHPMIEETGPRIMAVSVGNLATAAALVNHVLPYQQLFGPNSCRCCTPSPGPRNRLSR